MVLWACLASKCTSCALRVPKQACGIWPAKQHSFKIKALKVGLVWEQSGSMGFLGMWAPRGCVERGEPSFPGISPKQCWRIVSWLMGLARKPKPGQFPPSSIPVLPPVGLVCGAHILFLLGGAFCYQPLPPSATPTPPHPTPRRWVPVPLTCWWSSGQMTVLAQGWASNRGGRESWTSNFGRQLKD